MGCRQRDRQQHGRPGQIISTLICSQAAHRHSQEAGQQHHVREECQVKHVSGKPANTGQLEKKNYQADQEQLETISEFFHLAPLLAPFFAWLRLITASQSRRILLAINPVGNFAQSPLTVLRAQFHPDAAGLAQCLFR